MASTDYEVGFIRVKVGRTFPLHYTYRDLGGVDYTDVDRIRRT